MSITWYTPEIRAINMTYSNIFQHSHPTGPSGPRAVWSSGCIFESLKRDRCWNRGSIWSKPKLKQNWKWTTPCLATSKIVGERVIGISKDIFIQIMQVHHPSTSSLCHSHPCFFLKLLRSSCVPPKPRHHATLRLDPPLSLCPSDLGNGTCHPSPEMRRARFASTEPRRTSLRGKSGQGKRSGPVESTFRPFEDPHIYILLYIQLYKYIIYIII